jgi:hypothetical protein
MEPEGSLPCSQGTSTSSYPKPDQSNPYHSILSLYDPAYFPRNKFHVHITKNPSKYVAPLNIS